MRVTALRPDRRAPDRVLVEVDGVRFASLPPEVVRQLVLEEGEHLTPDKLAELRYRADVEAAKHVALRMLAARPRAVNDLLRRLRDRGLNPSAVAEVVGRLESAGLLNDREFARHFVRVQSAKGHGRSRLLADLLARGVERRLAERAIDEVLDAEGVDAGAEARSIAARRVAQLRGRKYPRATLRRRVLAFLERRGYRGREVGEMVDELLDRAASPPAGE